MKKIRLLSCILITLCFVEYPLAQTPGTVKWRYETGHFIVSSPAIGSDGTVYVGSRDNYLYAINPDGTLKWRYNTGWVIESSPAIGSDGTIYVGQDGLYAINRDGTLKWRYESSWSFNSSPAIGSDGTLFIGAWNYLHAINPDGTLKWRYLTIGSVDSSPAIGSDGTVYVGSDDNSFYAINPDGTMNWLFQTGDDIRSSPTVGLNGVVYIGSYNDSFYAINPDGTLKWQVQTGNTIESSPAIDDNGTIYVGSYDNYLYAIFSSSQGLADSPWPKFRQNNLNTGTFPSVNIADQIEFTFFSAGETIRKTFTVSNSTSTNITLKNCVFDHNAFSLNTPLPREILAGAASPLTAIIIPTNRGLYQSTCQITYETNGESKSVANQIQAGLFLEDGSESALTAHRVLDAYNTCLNEDPNSVAAKNNKGVLYRLLGEPEMAEQILLSALSRGQGDLHGYSGIKMNVGVTKSDQDSSAKAQLYYEAARRDIAANKSESSLAPQIHYNKAWEAYTRNDLDSADAFINNTLSHAKANDFLKAKAHVLRGALLFQRGDNESARSDFEQAMALDPDGPIEQMALENLDFLTGVDEKSDERIPMTFVLSSNYPNPFNPETTISFGLPRESEVALEIYNVRGQRIRMLFTRSLKAGWHHVTWNGTDDSGSRVGSGIYFIKMRAGKFESTHKMTLLR